MSVEEARTAQREPGFSPFAAAGTGEGEAIMKLVSTPYRWLWRTWWKNIDHWFWDLRNGVRNLFVFFEAAWWFRSWDWTGMIRLLEVSAREMRKSQKVSLHVGRERDEHRLMIVENLCKRMLADEYTENAKFHGDDWESLNDTQQKVILNHVSYMEQQDVIYLGKTLKFLRHWWT